MTSQIDSQMWITQPSMLAERCRGLALMWTPDVNWFNNDWLGPVPHVHDHATEIGYLAQGQLEIQVGGSKRVYKAGDFLMMPPGKFHNYWFHGTETVCFFVVVAPNHKFNRLRTANFTPDNFEGDAPFANVYETSGLPSNEHFECQCVTLSPGESEQNCLYQRRDRVIYIVSGTAQMQMHTLTGTMAANQYQHIPASTRHSISNPGFEPLVYHSLIITDPDTVHGVELKEEH
jgi:mannose-6-phosphate isomerase-like protein (cupin superfamily)